MTLEALKEAAHLRGCVVLDYSQSMAALIALKVYDEAQKAYAITIEGNSIIFIDDNLSEDKQCFALAHELGHITLNHKQADTEAERKRQETEADKFAFAVTGINPFEGDGEQ